MRKRWMSLLLACTMFLSFAVPVLAAPVTPVAPSWWKGEEYLTFPGDEVYQPEKWKKVLAMREEAEKGNVPPIIEGAYFAPGVTPAWYRDQSGNHHYADLYYGEDWNYMSPGSQYELALVLMKFAQNDYEKNGNLEAFRSPKAAFGTFAHIAQRDKYPWEHNATMWSFRTGVLADTGKEQASGKFKGGYGRSILELAEATDTSFEDFFASPWMDPVPQEKRDIMKAEGEKQLEEKKQTPPVTVSTDQDILMTLDDKMLFYVDFGGAMAELKNDRTMVPLRGVAERLGADVEWIAAEQKIVMTRANQTVEMQVGNMVAYVDGKAVTMDVAPYIKDGRTRIPARYMAEFFGQVVTWDAKKKCVEIRENYSVAGDSNVREWAIPMGSMLNMINFENPVMYGMPRGSRGTENRTICQVARDFLSGGWGIDNREELIATILSMTDHGHNDVFLALVHTGYADAYTKQIYNKYGDKGILAWDLFRMSNVAQNGYNAGYVTYAESLALIQPAAQRLKDNFSSWEEAYENYLYGYCWWSNTGVAGQNIFQTERGKIYTEMMANEEYKTYFDNSLFRQPIIPIPGVSAEDLRKEIM